MPRDNKTSLIQKIARQASLTFTDLSQSNIGDNKDLITLLTEVRAADLKIAPRKPNGSKSNHKPPVTYMHICETQSFSMGVFLLDSGATIPLHDHPGMNGMLKVLYGKVRIRCFDKLGKSPDQAESQTQFVPPLQPFQKDSIWRAVLRATVWYSEDSGPCLLTPQRENLHQIDAVEGPAAFLDILAPPYDPEDGRDCHYYKVLQTVPDAVRKAEQQEEESWLLEIPQPDDFWCGGEPYPGPKVSF
ncbi:2-aminoethanethiol dioxygenase [Esox lucius]|uniref:2-aminoethanethiol dioxygenase n=1 Tax=Esox lucius TaxID=8010 RepID=C1BXV4_ESOLU|nr:2-aminoethanethiol (cysteamine) dioxygenase a [Esox lucius]ACO13857.1 2-aminoethanethiol dioxygenase [Esox lucius]